MKTTQFTLTTLLVAAATITTAAHAGTISGFDGPLAPANFTVGNSGTLTGASPSLGTALFAPTLLVMTGSNATSPDPAGNAAACQGGIYGVPGSPCELSAVVAVAGTYSFSWGYSSSDADGAPGDIFGVIVDGVHIPLSDPGGAIAQNGTSTFTAGSSFGWFINCTDCINGAAMASVRDVSLVQVPEPTTAALAGLALLGAAGSTRRRSGR